MELTPHAKTVDALLQANHGQTLEGFIAIRRGDGASYRRIAEALHVVTQGVVDVTGETIRNWALSLEEITA